MRARANGTKRVPDSTRAPRRGGQEGRGGAGRSAPPVGRPAPRKKDHGLFSFHLARRNRNVLVALGKRLCLQLLHDLCRPGRALECHFQSHRHVDDDLGVGGLGARLDGVEVFAADVADPAGDVQEAEGGDLWLWFGVFWGGGGGERERRKRETGERADRGERGKKKNAPARRKRWPTRSPKKLTNTSPAWPNLSASPGSEIRCGRPSAPHKRPLFA